MSATLPPTITPTPTPAPQRGDRATFADRFDAFITWITTAVTQFGAVATNVYNNALDAFTSSTSAASSASAAAAASESASQIAGATEWVSGTTYAKGVCVWSPIDLVTYRRAVAGAGTLDPSADPANWTALSHHVAVLHVRDERAAGTHGGASVALDITQTRTLNTVKKNSITGASLASNTVTLPAGTYEIHIRAPGASVNNHKALLYNVTDSSYPIVGSSAFATSGSSVQVDSVGLGFITIASQKSFTIRHYTLTATATFGLGNAVGAAIGQVEVYAEAIFKRIA